MYALPALAKSELPHAWFDGCFACRQYPAADGKVDALEFGFFFFFEALQAYPLTILFAIASSSCLRSSTASASGDVQAAINRCSSLNSQQLVAHSCSSTSIDAAAATMYSLCSSMVIVCEVSFADVRD